MKCEALYRRQGQKTRKVMKLDLQQATTKGMVSNVGNQDMSKKTVQIRAITMQTTIEMKDTMQHVIYVEERGIKW